MLKTGLELKIEDRKKIAKRSGLEGQSDKSGFALLKEKLLFFFKRRERDILRPATVVNNTMSLITSTLAINIASLALPIMTLQVYDRILPNPGTGTLPILISGVCLAVVLEAILRLSRSYIISRAGAAYEHGMACNAMEKVLSADLSKMGRYGIGEHLHRMASVGKLKEFYNGYALTVCCELVFLFLYLGLIMYIGGILAVVPCLILTVFIAVSIKRGHVVRQAILEREQADDKRFNFLIESLEGIHTLKAFALEKFFERRYEALEEGSTISNYHVTQETAKSFNISAIFSHLMVTLVISLGAWLVLQGQLTTGGLIAVLLLSGRMMQPVQKMLALWIRYQDYVIARDHIEELFATPQKEIIEKNNEIEQLREGSLELKDVSFAYKGSQLPIFEALTLDVKPGECILLKGNHGSGKTTLFRLMSGIYTPTNGQVIIDGEDLLSYSPEQLVNHVGYIRKNAFIFRGTIRDNITSFGQIPEAKAQEIATLLDVDQDVAKLPSGFDTFLHGNETDSIPPGLKQRISIVRTLATKPRIILFDSADRSLDKKGYEMIYSLLARLKGKATLLIISEDRNICGLADRVITFNNGAIINSNNKGETNIKAYKELVL